MVAEQAIDEDHVARPAVRRRGRRRADHADAGRVDEQLVAGAALHDLGVAGDDVHAGLARRARHGSAPPGAAMSTGSPSSMIDGAGQIERHGAADREIVDGAADRELADVAAGKEQRIDHEGIGGEGEAVAMRGERREIEARLILERRQQRIVERRDEHVVDQILHGLAAAAMGKRDRRHVHLAARRARGPRERCSCRAILHAAASLRCRLTPPYW